MRDGRILLSSLTNEIIIILKDFKTKISILYDNIITNITPSTPQT